MNITIFNFFETNNDKYTTSISQIIESVQALYPSGIFDVVDMSSIKINTCIGCFCCWVKTPGLCIHKDEMSSNYKKIIGSDRIILLMPVQGGFLDSKVKAYIDRLIPLYHPYIEIYKGELMHEYRYDKYPAVDFYFPIDNLDEKDVQIIEDYCYRTAHHFRINSNRLIYSQAQCIKKPLDFRMPISDQPWHKYTNKVGKIIIYNGSPRGVRSNSLILIQKMVEGMNSKGIISDDIEVRSLSEISNHDIWAKDFCSHSRHIFVMPLYVHSMPSIVKAFIEKLSPEHGQMDMHLSFIVQSGFIESFQSAYLVPYFAQVSIKLNAIYGGTVVKGGIEGIQSRPDSSLSKLFGAFRTLGEQYIDEHQFNESYALKLSKPNKLSKLTILVFNILRLTGLTNSLWDKQLKDNSAFDKRNDCPYE